MAGTPPRGTDPLGTIDPLTGRPLTAPDEEDAETFNITLPSQEGGATVQREGTSYRSLASQWGLPSMAELTDTSSLFNVEDILRNAGVDVDNPAVQAMLAEPAIQELMQGEAAPGFVTFMQENYPQPAATAYDQAMIESGFDTFRPPPTEPGAMATLTSGTDEQIARFRRETPNFEENPATGWRRYPNGVLVSPDGQIAFDPTSRAPGSLAWQRDVAAKWSPEKVQTWADRLVEFGYLTKEQAKKASSSDPGFLGALSAYHANRYVYGKPVTGEQAGVNGAAAGSDKPPLVDFEDMKASTRGFVRDTYRQVYGQDPSEGEVAAMTDRIIAQAMDLQKMFRRKEYGGYSEMAASEAEARFIERLQTSPQGEFLRESEEENTRLRDALSQAVTVTRSLAG